MLNLSWLNKNWRFRPKPGAWHTRSLLNTFFVDDAFQSTTSGNIYTPTWSLWKTPVFRVNSSFQWYKHMGWEPILSFIFFPWHGGDLYFSQFCLSLSLSFSLSHSYTILAISLTKVQYSYYLQNMCFSILSSFVLFLLVFYVDANLRFFVNYFYWVKPIFLYAFLINNTHFVCSIFEGLGLKLIWKNC